MNTKLEVEILERELSALFAEYPELAEDEDLRAGMIEGSTEALNVVERIARQALDAGSLASAAATLAKDYSERRARFERREEAMRALALRIMKAADLRKAETPTATISLRATPPAVVITDEEALDERFWRVKREPSKSAIKDALKAGEFVAGATLSNGNEALSIRVA